MSLAENTKLTRMIWKAIYGNGKDGLLIRVDRIEQALKTPQRFISRLLPWILIGSIIFNVVWTLNK